MWYFTNLEGTLGYGDGRQVVAGETLTVDGEITLWGRGLHASPTIIDALLWERGPRLWRVELGDKVIEFCGRAVSNARTPVADYGDVTALAVRFAQWCAKRAMHLGGPHRKAYGYAGVALGINRAENAAACAVEFSDDCATVFKAANAAALAASHVAGDAAADVGIYFCSTAYDTYYAAERRRQERWWQLALALTA